LALPFADMLGSLLKSGKGVGADAMLGANGPASITAFAKRYQFQHKQLLSGMRNVRFQITFASDQDAAKKAFKREGTLQVLMSAVRAAGTDPEIQEEAQRTIPLLMDEEEADE